MKIRRNKLKAIFRCIVPAHFLLLVTALAHAQSDSIVLKDLQWDAQKPAGTIELSIPSDGSLLAGFIYTANGKQKHPTLLLLHGYPGNERNLDLGQVVRAHGWNVIYFDYRGSWGSQGQYSFKNCVQDVVNVVAFCKKHSDSLRIDTSNIVLFGHSLGGWVCLKALAELPGIKKGFGLSTANFYSQFKNTSVAQLEAFANRPNNPYSYFVLNTPVQEIYRSVIDDLAYFNLDNDAALAGKQIIMIDENNKNKELSESLRKKNHNYFDYEVWQTDHGFTNKRISLINKVIAFLDK
ncbi:MAG: alpha/beta fold hydrolase [Bacteroidetes bacterium]|nr:alpha/beta fold hydrolase [Bacteroidota bacterium]